MAEIRGNYDEFIITHPTPMPNGEIFYNDDTQRVKTLGDEVYPVLGKYFSDQLNEDPTITAFDVVIGLTGSRTARYRCDIVTAIAT